MQMPHISLTSWHYKSRFMKAHSLLNGEYLNLGSLLREHVF
jgi:hypothetical protein